MGRLAINKVILIILDGFGLALPGPGNPVTAENMPFLNNLISTYKSTSLVASGLVVGLEWGTYGNSEVGHSAIGTGRVVVQSMARINIEIQNGEFFKNRSFLKILEHAKQNNSKVHLIGCVSPGGIHSHEGHLVGLLNFFIKQDFSSLCLHVITDGEDSAQEEGIKSLNRLQDIILRSKARIASIAGRNYTMDRVKNWNLVKKSWDVMVHGADKQAISPKDYLEHSYKKSIFDADVAPASFMDEAGESNKIQDGDALIFFNFRNDRMRQIVSTFVQEEFDGFDRGEIPKNLLISTMTNYNDEFKTLIAYPPQTISNSLGEVLSKNKLSQLRIAESEKEAHVTNFFNGGKIIPYIDEERIIISSRSLLGKDYIDHPEMRAPQITETIIKNIKEHYKLNVINFANTDMVAHTGDVRATTKALNIIDESLKKIVQATDLSNTAILITADHGNCEEMIDPLTSGADTQHSTANVPLILISEKFKEESAKGLDNLYKEDPKGSLIDVAPTILDLLGIEKPKEMSGNKIYGN